MSYKKYLLTYSIKEFINFIKDENYQRYFTEKEINVYGKRKNKGSLAARFLIKKHIIKQLNVDVNYTDIEILNNDFGKPTLKIHIKPDIETEHIYFSISHTKEQVSVIVVYDENAVRNNKI